jgi:N-acylneuraminate cytidylyltransferase
MCGRPALAYSIEAALDSRLFEEVVVSTDTARIAEIAISHGAKVPFLREAALADDQTPVSAATVDALHRLDPAGARFTAVAQLMPNAPLRDAEDVRASFRQFIVTGAPAQISVATYGWQPAWWAMRRTADLQLVPLFPDEVARRSQDLTPLFCPTGAIWWARADVLRNGGTYHVPNRTGWEIAADHAIDIDTEEDWRLAEALMQLRLSDARHVG